jgi:hypothetical protein
VEPVEQLRPFGLGDAGAAVFDGEADTAAVGPDADPDHAVRAGVAAGYYLDLFGAGHLIPYEGTNPLERFMARVTLAFFDRYVLGQAGALEIMTRDGNVTGTAALVSGGQPPP